MKASELLKQLEELIEEHGDKDVYVRFDSYCHNTCDGIEYRDDYYVGGDYFLI